MISTKLVSKHTYLQTRAFCYRAVYTGIKKKHEFFSHSGFSLEVARQLPLNTAKNRIEKTTSEVWFFETLAPRSPVLFGFLVTWDVTFRGITRSPRRTAHYVRSKVDGSHACAPCAFLAQKPKSYGFFWQCKRYNKKPRFFGFWFLPM